MGAVRKGFFHGNKAPTKDKKALTLFFLAC